jgi:hypothetical protein
MIYDYNKLSVGQIEREKVSKFMVVSTQRLRVVRGSEKIEPPAIPRAAI